MFAQGCRSEFLFSDEPETLASEPGILYQYSSPSHVVGVTMSIWRRGLQGPPLSTSQSQCSDNACVGCGLPWLWPRSVG